MSEKVYVLAEPKRRDAVGVTPVGAPVATPEHATRPPLEP